MNMDVASTFELLVPVYQTTEPRIQADSNLHSLFIIVFTTARTQLSHQNQFQETPEKAFRKLRESSLVWQIMPRVLYVHYVPWHSTHYTAS
jgi:hypothetical protein